MDAWLEWFKENMVMSEMLLGSLLITLLVIGFVWLLRRAFLRVVYKKITDPKQLYQWQKGTQYIFYLIVTLSIFTIWVPETRNIGTYLGLLSAGLAIALKDPLTNLVGWIFILLRHPFRVGDRIEIGAFSGDVVDIRLFQFSLLEIGNWVNADQSTGRVVHIPNGKVFLESLANYSQGIPYIWNEIPVTITFESNWEKAKEILTKISERYSAQVDPTEISRTKYDSEFVIAYKHLTPTVYTNLAGHGVVLTIRYLCEPRRRRSSAEKIIEDFLKSFDEHEDIQLAYPTYRVIPTPTSDKSPI